MFGAAPLLHPAAGMQLPGVGSLDLHFTSVNVRCFWTKKKRETRLPGSTALLLLNAPLCRGARR